MDLLVRIGREPVVRSGFLQSYSVALGGIKMQHLDGDCETSYGESVRTRLTGGEVDQIRSEEPT